MQKRKKITMCALLSLTALTATSGFALDRDAMDRQQLERERQERRLQDERDRREAMRIAIAKGLLPHESAEITKKEDIGRKSLHRDFERSLDNLKSNEYLERNELKRRRAHREAMNENHRYEFEADEGHARERIEDEREDFLMDEKLHRLVSLLKAYVHGRASADEVVSSWKNVLKDAQHVN